MLTHLAQTGNTHVIVEAAVSAKVEVLLRPQKEKNKKEEGRLQGNVYHLSENTCMKLLQFLSHWPRPVMVTKLCQYITFKDRESEKKQCILYYVINTEFAVALVCLLFSTFYSENAWFESSQQDFHNSLPLNKRLAL